LEVLSNQQERTKDLAMMDRSQRLEPDRVAIVMELAAKLLILNGQNLMLQLMQPSPTLVRARSTRARQMKQPPFLMASMAGLILLAI